MPRSKSEVSRPKLDGIALERAAKDALIIETNVAPKRWYHPASLYGIVTQKTSRSKTLLAKLSRSVVCSSYRFNFNVIWYKDTR
jgi:hypothetical protein